MGMGGAGKGEKRQRHPLSLTKRPYMTDRITAIISDYKIAIP
jgi:hypothetical protein